MRKDARARERLSAGRRPQPPARPSPFPAAATRLGQLSRCGPAQFLWAPPLPVTASHWPGVRLGVVTSLGRLRCGSRPPPIGCSAPGRYPAPRDVSLLASFPRPTRDPPSPEAAHQPRAARLIASAPTRAFCPNIRAGLRFS